MASVPNPIRFSRPGDSCLCAIYAFQNPIDSIDCFYGAMTSSGGVGAGISCSSEGPQSSTSYCQLFQPTQSAQLTYGSANRFDSISIHCKLQIYFPNSLRRRRHFPRFQLLRKARGLRDRCGQTFLLSQHAHQDPDGFNGGDNAIASVPLILLLVQRLVRRGCGQPTAPGSSSEKRHRHIPTAVH